MSSTNVKNGMLIQLSYKNEFLIAIERLINRSKKITSGKNVLLSIYNNSNILAIAISHSIELFSRIVSL